MTRKVFYLQKRGKSLSELPDRHSKSAWKFQIVGRKRIIGFASGMIWGDSRSQMRIFYLRKMRKQHIFDDFRESALSRSISAGLRRTEVGYG